MENFGDSNTVITLQIQMFLQFKMDTTLYKILAIMTRHFPRLKQD